MKNNTLIKEIETATLNINGIHETKDFTIEASWFGEQSDLEDVLENHGLKIDYSHGIRGVFNNEGNEAGDNTFEGTLLLEKI